MSQQKSRQSAFENEEDVSVRNNNNSGRSLLLLQLSLKCHFVSLCFSFGTFLQIQMILDLQDIMKNPLFIILLHKTIHRKLLFGYWWRLKFSSSLYFQVLEPVPLPHAHPPPPPHPPQVCLSVCHIDVCPPLCLYVRLSVWWGNQSLVRKPTRSVVLQHRHLSHVTASSHQKRARVINWLKWLPQPACLSLSPFDCLVCRQVSVSAVALCPHDFVVSVTSWAQGGNHRGLILYFAEV